MKNAEYYQRAIELTPEQKKAFASLERAVKKCNKANIYFYQVLDKLGALNGNNVESVEDGGSSDAPACLQFKVYPKVKTDSGWADDNHFVVLDSCYEDPEELTPCPECGRDYGNEEVYSCVSCGFETCTDCGGRCGCLGKNDDD